MFVAEHIPDMGHIKPRLHAMFREIGAGLRAVSDALAPLSDGALLPAHEQAARHPLGLPQHCQTGNYN